MKWSWKHSASVLAVGLLLAACGGGSTTPQPTTGTVEGTVTRVGAAGSSSIASSSVAEPAAVVPGSFFIEFKKGRPETRFEAGAVSSRESEGFAFQADGSFAFNGATFVQQEFVSLASELALYRVEGLTEQETREVVDQLRQSGAVADVFPNWVLSAAAVSADPYYEMQAWHYEQLRLPEAWDIEDGTTSSVTVAVLDTGRYDHEDLVWSANGAGLVTAVDGTLDPVEGPVTNPFTRPGGSSHGTHVAGTIGAVSDNGIGGAGVNWNADLLPVKVLDADGSGGFDGILMGVMWAAGVLTVDGHQNTTPAQVINMSLGGAVYEECPAAIDANFGALAELGTYIVVAAGNNGSPADIYFPANCSNVITVGATGPTGERSYYSNYGAFVDVMAPGGDADYDHPTHPTVFSYAGVVSTAVTSGGLEVYAAMQGTSMAAPHVSGVVSLMLAQDPTLTLNEIRERLHNASLPLSQAECNVPSVGFEGQNVCGAGLLDAAAALGGVTLAMPTAVVYAIRYEGEETPVFGVGNLSSLELAASNRTDATALPNGDFAYKFEGLAPGKYVLVGLELRDASSGISNVDRVGLVDEVEVVAGGTIAVTVPVTPIYLALR